jgi:transcriptional regulator with XRE-family HTH domain
MTERRDTVLDMSDIAHAVRERRRELRLRFEDVANMAGVSRHLVSSIERGDANDQLDKLLRILDALQIKVDVRRSTPRHVEPPPAPPRPARTRTKPAVAIEDMHRDAGRIICLDCEASVRDLSRHVRQQHGISLVGYRQRWGLDEDVRLRPLTDRETMLENIR